jgi:hypothetical protein
LRSTSPRGNHRSLSFAGLCTFFAGDAISPPPNLKGVGVLVEAKKIAFRPIFCCFPLAKLHYFSILYCLQKLSQLKLIQNFQNTCGIKKETHFLGVVKTRTRISACFQPLKAVLQKLLLEITVFKSTKTFNILFNKK